MKELDIPKGWKKVKLKEVLKEVNERNKGEEVKRVLSVTNSQGFINQEEYFEGTVHSTNISNYKIVRKKQFAYNPSRVNVGSIDILQDYEDGALSPMYVVFEVNTTKLLPEYFNYYFQTNRFYENVKNNTQGSVRNSLSFKALADFHYLLPSITEQEKIVKILKNIDYIINKCEILLKEKDKFIKSQFVEMFGDIQKNNRKWEKVKICDLCENLDNMRKPVSSSVRTSGKYPYYGASGIVDYVDNYIFDERLLLVSEDGANLTARVTPIAFSIEGKNWVNNHAHVLRFEDYNIQKYVEFYFSMIDLTRYITGTAQPKLNQAKLNSIIVPLPDYESIKIFVKINNQIDKQKILLEKQKQNYEKLKKGLMQKLLTGKVRVKI